MKIITHPHSNKKIVHIYGATTRIEPVRIYVNKGPGVDMWDSKHIVLLSILETVVLHSTYRYIAVRQQPIAVRQQ